MKDRVLAIDIGGSKLALGCVDGAGKILEKITVPLRGGVTSRTLTDAVMQGAGRLDLTGVEEAGATIPGLADAERGIWLYAPYSGISGFPVAEIFSKLLGMRVSIENDVNACALAEKRFGCCRDIGDYFWITISNGIGGSTVQNGKLYRGYSGSAGEIGHFIVEENDGLPCGCGNKGCLEAQAAGPAIAKLYEILSGKRTPPETRSKEIGELARSGDAHALAAFEMAGYYIGKALSYAVNFLNPEAVILGGGVMMDEDLLMPSVKQTLHRFLFEKANRDVKVLKTALGYDAALLGAAALCGGTAPAL